MMKILGSVFWRIWYNILLGLPIILMSPLLLLFTSREKWYPYTYKLGRIWATIIIYGMGFSPEITRLQKMEQKSYMLIANHTSMVDIMLMFYVVKNPFVFVGKHELAKIPIFGFFYKRTCILVDRSDSKSRREVFNHAQRRLSQGLSICIFPEGGISDETSIILDSFKDGAFRLAIEHQIPIVPMVFYDNKKRFPAVFFEGSPGRMRVKILQFIETKGKDLHEKRNLKNEARQLILAELEKNA